MPKNAKNGAFLEVDNLLVQYFSSWYHKGMGIFAIYGAAALAVISTIFGGMYATSNVVNTVTYEKPDTYVATNVVSNAESLVVEEKEGDRGQAPLIPQQGGWRGIGGPEGDLSRDTGLLDVEGCFFSNRLLHGAHTGALLWL